MKHLPTRKIIIVLALSLAACWPLLNYSRTRPLEVAQLEQEEPDHTRLFKESAALRAKLTAVEVAKPNWSHGTPLLLAPGYRSRLESDGISLEHIVNSDSAGALQASAANAGMPFIQSRAVLESLLYISLTVGDFVGDGTLPGTSTQ